MINKKFDTDVTDQVEFGDVDGEGMPIKRCLWGQRFGY
jgi:hypothetical protein